MKAPKNGHQKMYGYALLLYIMLLSGCSKDPASFKPDPINKPDPKPVPGNKPPGSFDLIGVTDGASKVDVLPSFSWNTSVDPDGDPVAYDLLLDTDADPKTVVAANLTGTSFTVGERLHLIADYHWKVVAKDGKGGSAPSTVYGFTTRSLGKPTDPASTAAFMKGVYGHTTTLFADKLFTIGGYDGRNILNGVSESSDGANWEPKIEFTFLPRFYHTTTEFHDELWVIGGRDDNNDLKNDVWHTYFGSDWTEATPAAPFSGRSGHATVVFNDKIWVIGGTSKVKNYNDVWYSSDGIDWVLATAAAAFSGREEHTAAVFDNKIWVIGGYANEGPKNDVWYSSDGVTWAEATSAAAFTPRSSHSTVVFDEKLWVIGGVDASGYKNDIWSSDDGIHWTLGIDKAPFSARASHTTVVFDNKVWVIGGQDGTLKNDVWALD